MISSAESTIIWPSSKVPLTSYVPPELILTGEQYEKLIPRLLEYMKMDDHCVNNSYSIYNIYYDTDDNSVIRHSISKPYYKEKLRLRSYKIPQSPSDKVFLELKKKINEIVNKRRAIITLEEAYNFLEFGERPKCTDFITEQVINEIEYYLSHTKVNPTVYIGYNRIAFFCKEDKDFRLTIDSKIITRREDLFLESGCHGTDILKPNEYLMEVKILDAIPMWLAEIFSELKIYNTHFSKYGNEYMTYCQEQNNHNKNRREKIC